MQYYLEHLATSVAAVSGVLAGRGKQVDLFGVVVLGLVTALGGGTLRRRRCRGWRVGAATLPGRDLRVAGRLLHGAGRLRPLRRGIDRHRRQRGLRLRG